MRGRKRPSGSAPPPGHRSGPRAVRSPPLAGRGTWAGGWPDRGDTWERAMETRPPAARWPPCASWEGIRPPPAPRKSTGSNRW